MELSEVMRTTPAIRRFADAPVTDDVVHRVLDTARFAPSGGNRQGWHVIVVRDPATRDQLQQLYQASWREYWAHVLVGKAAFSPGPTRFSQPWVDLDAARETPAPNEFADHLASHPVLLVVCVALDALAVLDHGLDRQSIVGGGSIYPFCQNVMLAARNEGLGGVMTTVLCRQEPAVLELLGVPPSHVLAALIVLGHPSEQITRLRRRTVDEFTTIDRFDGSALQRPAPGAADVQLG